MQNPLSRQAIGMVIRGDDLVLVHASVRGWQIDWSLDRVPGALRDGDASPPIVPERYRESRAPRILVWPIDRMLRRDIDAASQSEDDMRAVVGENMSSFFPTADESSVLWDLHRTETTDGRAIGWLGGAFRHDLSPVLEKLARVGLSPTRIVPSGVGCAPLRYAGDASRQNAPERMLEITPSGWAAHMFSGLRWSGCRAGPGAPPDELLREAREHGWVVCRWEQRVEPEEATRAMTLEHVALGGAMLGAWPRAGAAPEFNLLGRAKGRRWLTHPWTRWTAAAAALTLALLVFADARLARARSDAARLDRINAELASEADRVERLRAANDGIVGVHDRLWRLESGYTPRWRVLSALTAATPDSAWVQRLELTDDDFVMDVESASPAEVLQRIEASPALSNAQQASGAQTTETGASRFRVLGKIVHGAAGGGS